MMRPSDKPTLFLIGDSTVKNGQGNGGGNQWGWGSFISDYFDSTRINVENHALGGTSSRTFRTRGLWTKVLDKIKPGDYVIMQFGHNDGSPLDDTARARGTIKSTGDEVREIYNPITKQQEVVHTYGWYMSRFIIEAREKGAIPIVCSPVPRSNWTDGKVKRGGEGYSKLAEETARTAGAHYIDLNLLISEKYDALGEDRVRKMFPADHTHTNMEGAKVNAAAVVDGLRGTPGFSLNHYLNKSKN
ncbi:lysophospholipase L1-like esterase [Arcticibacter pallidicorallinus]|uniref:Lysophospholipase L1-like esterase n=1 Tax=Arcticibacter pallidicorallinus TaxID=1259464 RepID=A0A2T0U121_9SPHI|nr:rhamnogalacturonan acetylesterase [Arcticibacter pallidicorallinus]PRY51593.1 lysophospholipase L1-like esterase [Arcticibacter pallidicorallinus]